MEKCKDRSALYRFMHYCCSMHLSVRMCSRAVANSRRSAKVVLQINAPRVQDCSLKGSIYAGSETSRAQTKQKS